MDSSSSQQPNSSLSYANIIGPNHNADMRFTLPPLPNENTIPSSSAGNANKKQLQQRNTNIANKPRQPKPLQQKNTDMEPQPLKQDRASIEPQQRENAVSIPLNPVEFERGNVLAAYKTPASILNLAISEVKNGDLQQGGGKGWLAVDKALKQIGKQCNLPDDLLRNHGMKSRFAHYLDGMFEPNNEISYLFRIASELHGNYYDGWLTKKTVEDSLANVALLIEILGKIEKHCLPIDLEPFLDNL